MDQLSVVQRVLPDFLHSHLKLSMNILLSSSRRRLLPINFQPTPHLRRLAAATDKSNTPLQDESKEDHLANQVIHHLEQTPDNEWVASETLDSLIFSSSFSAPSPGFLSQITWRLKSYPRALSFLNYLNHNSRYLKNHDDCLSSAFQSAFELASREPDSKTKLVELYEASKEMNVLLKDNAVKLLISLFGRAGTVDHSVLVYEELNPGLRNTGVRNVLIGVLLRGGRVDAALKVLDEMFQGESEFFPNEITGDIVFSCLTLRSGSIVRPVTDKEIIELVLKLSDHGVFPNTIWLTQFFTRLCKNGGTDQAMDVLDFLIEQKAPLGASPFNTVLTVLAKRKDVIRMNALLNKMKEVGIVPSSVTFGILINCLCKSQRVDEALELFESMHRGEGSEEITIAADVITYNTLIDGLCKVGRPEKGEELMKRMRTQKGCSPDIVSYTCLIDGFCRAGDIEKAQRLIDQMKEEGVKPDVLTLNRVVVGMCRHLGVSSAVQYFRNMQKEGLKGNGLTYATLINAFCNVNNLDKAVDWFNEMLEAGCSPDAIVYYNLISGLCLARRADDAMMMVSKLKEAGFSLDLVAYNMLIGCFCDTVKVDWIQKILTDMEESGVKPDGITHNTLILFFSKNKDFYTARRVMRKMVKEGFHPTVETYETMINAYCSKGDMGGAMKLFREMGSGSIVSPNIAIFNILIESFCKEKDVDEALSLMDSMKHNGLQPDTTTYNAIFKGLRSRNLLEAAVVFMDEMIEHACPPDYITLEILTAWFSDIGENEKLKRFLQRC